MAVARASSETAHRTARRRARRTAIGLKAAYALLAPARWNVPTTGRSLTRRLVTVGPGTRGSWRWTTSNSSSLSARIVRSAQAGSGAIGATLPFDDSGTDLPSGVTPPSGGGPSHGASTRTSWPSDRSALARPSTWACTPPGGVRLYGQTWATRIAPHG